MHPAPLIVPLLLCVVPLAGLPSSHAHSQTQAQAQESRPASAPAGLLAALRAKDFATRRDAVRGCRGNSEPEVLAALRDTAQTDGHPNIRAFALEALIAARPADLFGLLQQVLERDKDPFPRQVALLGIGQTRDPRAYDLLLPRLAGDEAAFAARGLGALGDARAFAPMAKLLETCSEQMPVREHVPAALVALDRERGVDALLDLFAGTNEELTSAIATVLAEQPLPRVRQAMLQHLESPSRTERFGAMRVLGGIADVSCLDALLRCLGRDEELREACALALGRTGLTPAARPLCERLLAEETPGARRAIASALRSLRDPGIVPDLLTALDRESDELVRVQLVAALGAQGDRRAVAALMELVDDETVTHQPQHLSRILTFPFNVRLGDAAVWAAATLAEDKPPFRVEDLSAFPAPHPRAACTAARTRIKAWWQSLADKRPYGRGR